MDLMVKLPTARATASRRSFSEGGWTLPRIKFCRHKIFAGHRLTVLLASKTSFRRQHPSVPQTNAGLARTKKPLSSGFVCAGDGC